MTLLLAALLAATVSTQSTPAKKPVDISQDRQAAANAEFQKRMDAYLELRESLGKKLEPLKTTESASELQGRQQALAAALRAARANAKQGDLIPVAVQEQIRAAVKADMQRRTPATKQAAMVEVPDGPMPGINKNYPDRAALPTVPPLLLARLPRLPDNLQYRFFGRHVVLLDGDTEIVVDYVTDAVPR
jgi:flagellar basal body L-ring protein FlgH